MLTKSIALLIYEIELINRIFASLNFNVLCFVYFWIISSNDSRRSNLEVSL